MTIENEGAIAPANDTALPTHAVEADLPEVNTETDEPDLDDNGEPITKAAPVDDTEEVDYEGQKVRVPKQIKDALLRHADYTRKTQELAQQRKEFEATREQSATIDKDYVGALANVKAYDTELAKYANVDWTTFEQTDPTAAAQHWRIFSQLKDARSEAEKSATTIQQRLATETQRSRATRFQEVQAELQKSLPEWSPGNELDVKLAKFGTANGLSQQDIAEAALRNPAFVKLLNLARIGAENETKAAKAAKLAANQAAQPAVEIGAKAPSSAKDPERMGNSEWLKWRNSQLKKKA